MFKKQPSDSDRLSDLFEKNTIRKSGGEQKPMPLSLPDPVDGAPALKPFRRPPEAGGLHPMLLPFAQPEDAPDTQPKGPSHSVARLNRLYDMSPGTTEPRDPRADIIAFHIESRKPEPPQAKPEAKPEAKPARAEYRPESRSEARAEAKPAPEKSPSGPNVGPGVGPSVGKDSPELQSRLRKTQLRLKAVQILLRISAPLGDRLKELSGLMCESFSLWQIQIHLPVAHRPDQLQILGSYTRTSSKVPRPNADSARQLQKVFKEGREATLRQSESQHLMLPLTHRSEKLGVVEAVFSPAHSLSADDQLTLKSLSEEIAFYLAEEQKHELDLALSDNDTLTGLLNHRALQQRMEECLKASGQLPVSLILLDLDFFRQINEVHGYNQGDQVLRQVAGLLRRTLGEQVALARFGGEEFTVLLPKTTQQEALDLAGELRQAIACEKISGKFNSSLGISASLGVATLKEARPKARQTLIEQAFGALSVAKEKGRNQVQAYTQPKPEAKAEAKTETKATAPEKPGEKFTLPVGQSDKPVEKPLAKPMAEKSQPAVTKARKWSEIVLAHQTELADEWAHQTEDYGVPEVSDAVKNLAPRLPRLVENLCSLLDGKQQIEDLEKMPLSYYMPSQIVAEIRRGQHQLISYEVAFMLLQESLLAVLGKHGSVLQDAIERFFLCINEKLTALKSELQKGR